MLIGDLDYPIQESVLFFILVASLIFNTYLFKRGEGNYSIKYQLMRNQQFFRKHILITYLIEAIYKVFFALPFVLLATLSILAGIRDPNNLPSILINGLIILLILYPTKIEFFYYKIFSIWVFTFGSQISTFFIFEKNGQQSYMILSFIFYTGNILFFYLALMAIENTYWQLPQAIQSNKQQFSEINKTWAQQPDQIPIIFKGGLYGFFCKSDLKYFIYLVLYAVSCLFLVAYAVIVHFVLGSKLGYVGLVSALIFDIFLKIFNSLNHKQRTTKSVYIVLVIGRILSFCFGLENWLIGYCALYFFVSIFIGWIIIDKHFPLIFENGSNQPSVKSFLNAFKTPQFILIVFTVQIVVMILVQAYALPEKDPTVTYNNVSIPIWQWAIIVLVAAWIIIVYLLSIRILTRHQKRIFNLVQFYFGIVTIRQEHIYMFISYLLLVGLGLYSNLYLNQKSILIGCIFLPLIYLSMLGIWTAWINNQYMILADTEEYNRILQKKFEIKTRRQKMIQGNAKLKEDKKKYILMSTVNRREVQGEISSIKDMFTSIGNKKVHDDNQESILLKAETSGENFNPLQTLESFKNIESKENIGNFQPLRNWREEQLQLSEIWKNLTPNDKKILVLSVIFLILLAGYCATEMLWASSKFAISLMVCLLSFLTFLPYVKFYNTRSEILVSEIMLNWGGFCLGIGYWGAFSSQVIGPIVFCVGYMSIGIYIVIRCYKTEADSKQKLKIINPAVQILLCMVFIQIVLSIFSQMTVAVVFAIIFFVFIVLQAPIYYILVHDHVPKHVIGICCFLIGSSVITVSVLGYVYHVISSFTIFTIVMCIIFIAFFAASTSIYIIKKLNHQENPSIYSAFGEPHYRFQSSKQVMKGNSNHMVLFSFSMSTIVIYSVIVSVFFQNKEWAVYGLSVFWLTQFLVNFQAAISSYHYLGQEKKKKSLTDQIVKQTLMKLKTNYLADEIMGEDSDYYLKLLQEQKQKAKNGNPTAEDWRRVVELHDLYIKNSKEEEKFCFFWIALITFSLLAKRKQMIAETLAEIKSIQTQLSSIGIILQSLQSTLKPEEKYENLMNEIKNLDPFDYVFYEHTLNAFRDEQNAKKLLNQEAHRKENQNNEKRNEELYNELKHKFDTINTEDQIGEFKKLLSSLGRRNLFCDEDFPPNQKILGQALEVQVKSWRRPNVGQVLIKGGISADDVKQGQIGDCYLISSFAVLGQQKIKNCLGYDNEGNQLWSNGKGAYLVKFHKFSKQIFVIIDDFLPVNENDEWVFAKSEQPSQYWPCILQKAYAKLYNGYDKIVQGKCHQVFAEFTGGFPYQILLQEYKSNIYGLWNQLISSKKNGYLMAAGSPSNAKGDTVCSKRGIVQGHAYSILQTNEVDQYKLIKLKNPHGSGGNEWNGDFSDRSELMTKRMMGLLSHKKTKDGIFWMPLEDFIIEFKSLYICAVFNQKWVKLGPIKGTWTQENSYGTPNFKDAYKNPHYGIKVSKKCKIFISLAQQSISSLKGKNYIYMKALKNGGKRITPQTLTVENSIGRAKRPIDMVSISYQLQLEASYYPYIFTLMVSCDEPGKTGKYILQAYCDDKDAAIIDDLQFDRKLINESRK